jgi:outer membrane protein
MKLEISGRRNGKQHLATMQQIGKTTKGPFKKLSFLMFPIVHLASQGALPAYSNTSFGLDECFQAAIATNEVIASHGQQVIQAKEIVAQARGSILPNISGYGTFAFSQAPSDPVAQSFYPTYQPNVRLAVTQPVFRGLREFAALRRANQIAEMEGHNKEMALIQLYNDVAFNFFALLAYEQELSNLKTQLQLYDERISELNQRQLTGQSSSSEVLTARATQALVQADYKQVNRNRNATWEVFSFLTGLAPGVTLRYELPRTNPKVKPISYYIESLQSRPDIQAAKEGFQAANESVTIARGAHLPSVDFQGNYYLVRPVGVFSEIRWDFQLTLSIPIFAGGIIQAQVRQAESQRVQADLALSRTVRLAEQAVRTLYENYELDSDQLISLETSTELNEKNYQALKSDYSKGLTRNLDVLVALTQLQESRRALNRVRWNTQATWQSLQVLSAARTLSQNRK